ncbi:general odorant-binding protein 67-like [Anopheles darlingi]|uniref:general odorant-binding protein 67-like n=1 Tax=Anopheles darlingi TaxID=43151 RepID=UPI0021001940|nr:general odorant-binding protein 67-like [Anopheles darlingi]
MFAKWLIAASIALCSSPMVFADNPCLKGPPVAKNAAECCVTPSLVEPSAFMACHSKWISQTKRQMAMEGIPRGCCVAECVMNQTGLYSDGKIDRAALTELYLGSAKPLAPEWKQITLDAIDGCFGMADSIKEEIDAGAKLTPAFDGEQICHPISGTILACMGMTLFAECPAKLFTVNDACNQLKSYHSQCPFL